MPSDAGRRTVTIRWSLIRNLVLLLVVLTGLVLSTTVHTGRRVAETVSRSLIDGALDRTEADLTRFFAPVRTSLGIAAAVVRRGGLDPEDAGAFERIFAPVIDGLPQVSGINIGDARGYGRLLMRWDAGWRTRVVRIDEWGDRIEYEEWADDREQARRWVVEEPGPDERYDPRLREWYRVVAAELEAPEPSREIFWTEPYSFFTTGDLGMTASMVVEDAGGRRYVLSYDVLLTDVTGFTRRLRPSENGFALLLESDGRLLGLPDLPEFESPEVRQAALLARPRDLDIPVLADAARAFGSLPAEERDAPELIFDFRSGGHRYWVDFRPIEVGANRALTVLVAVAEDDLIGAIVEQRLLVVGISLAGFAVAVSMAFLLARRYSRPLAQLAENSQRIAGLELEALEPVASNLEEVDRLASAHARMRVALDSFARYVPVEVIRELLARGEAAKLGGERRELTALFTDIQDFTSISEQMPPEALTAHLAGYFRAMLEIIQGDGGEVTQMLGDGFFALFGAPVPDPDHASHAAASVLRCRERLAELNREWQERGLPVLHTRFGMASGPAVVGNVGSSARLVYTAVGDTVNLASRLEGLNRFYGTWVLASEELRRKAGDGFEWRLIDTVRVKGKSKPVEIFELLGTAGAVPAERLRFADAYVRALSLYRARRFSDARAEVAALLAERPDDPSLERLRELCGRFEAQPPPEGWDGVSDFFVK